MSSEVEKQGKDVITLTVERYLSRDGIIVSHQEGIDR